MSSISPPNNNIYVGGGPAVFATGIFRSPVTFSSTGIPAVGAAAPVYVYSGQSAEALQREKTAYWPTIETRSTAAASTTGRTSTVNMLTVGCERRLLHGYKNQHPIPCSSFAHQPQTSPSYWYTWTGTAVPSTPLFTAAGTAAACRPATAAAPNVFPAFATSTITTTATVPTVVPAFAITAAAPTVIPSFTTTNVAAHTLFPSVSAGAGSPAVFYAGGEAASTLHPFLTTTSSSRKNAAAPVSPHREDLNPRFTTDLAATKAHIQAEQAQLRSSLPYNYNNRTLSPLSSSFNVGNVADSSAQISRATPDKFSAAAQAAPFLQRRLAVAAVEASPAFINGTALGGGAANSMKTISAADGNKEPHSSNNSGAATSRSVSSWTCSRTSSNLQVGRHLSQEEARMSQFCAESAAPAAKEQPPVAAAPHQALAFSLEKAGNQTSPASPRIRRVRIAAEKDVERVLRYQPVDFIPGRVPVWFLVGRRRCYSPSLFQKFSSSATEIYTYALRHVTPAALRDYARSLGAGKSWSGLWQHQEEGQILHAQGLQQLQQKKHGSFQQSQQQFLLFPQEQPQLYAGGVANIPQKMEKDMMNDNIGAESAKAAATAAAAVWDEQEAAATAPAATVAADTAALALEACFLNSNPSATSIDMPSVASVVAPPLPKNYSTHTTTTTTTRAGARKLCERAVARVVRPLIACCFTHTATPRLYRFSSETAAAATTTASSPNQTCYRGSGVVLLPHALVYTTPGPPPSKEIGGGGGVGGGAAEKVVQLLAAGEASTPVAAAATAATVLGAPSEAAAVAETVHKNTAAGLAEETSEALMHHKQKKCLKVENVLFSTNAAPARDPETSSTRAAAGVPQGKFTSSLRALREKTGERIPIAAAAELAGKRGGPCATMPNSVCVSASSTTSFSPRTERRAVHQQHAEAAEIGADPSEVTAATAAVISTGAVALQRAFSDDLYCPTHLFDVPLMMSGGGAAKQEISCVHWHPPLVNARLLLPTTAVDAVQQGPPAQHFYLDSEEVAATQNHQAQKREPEKPSNISVHLLCMQHHSPAVKATSEETAQQKNAAIVEENVLEKTAPEEEAVSEKAVVGRGDVLGGEVMRLHEPRKVSTTEIFALALGGEEEEEAFINGNCEHGGIKKDRKSRDKSKHRLSTHLSKSETTCSGGNTEKGAAPATAASSTAASCIIGGEQRSQSVISPAREALAPQAAAAAPTAAAAGTGQDHRESDEQKTRKRTTDRTKISCLNSLVVDTKQTQTTSAAANDRKDAAEVHSVTLPPTEEEGEASALREWLLLSGASLDPALQQLLDKQEPSSEQQLIQQQQQQKQQPEKTRELESERSRRAVAAPQETTTLSEGAADSADGTQASLLQKIRKAAPTAFSAEEGPVERAKQQQGCHFAKIRCQGEQPVEATAANAGDHHMKEKCYHRTNLTTQGANTPLPYSRLKSCGEKTRFSTPTDEETAKEIYARYGSRVAQNYLQLLKRHSCPLQIINEVSVSDDATAAGAALVATICGGKNATKATASSVSASITAANNNS